jgi:hypothetical protein
MKKMIPLIIGFSPLVAFSLLTKTPDGAGIHKLSQIRGRVFAPEGPERFDVLPGATRPLYERDAQSGELGFRPTGPHVDHHCVLPRPQRGETPRTPPPSPRPRSHRDRPPPQFPVHEAQSTPAHHPLVSRSTSDAPASELTSLPWDRPVLGGPCR